MQFSPFAFDDFSQASSGCELNVNARMYKHDVTRFMSFVPGCFILLVEALQMQLTAKICILVQQYLM